MKTLVDGVNSNKPLRVKASEEFDNLGNNFIPQEPNPYSPTFQKEVEANKPPPEYINITEVLASRLIFYPHSEIYIKPFTAKEVILLNYADVSDSSRPIAQAINSVLYGDVNCFDLTYYDVKQILCWLRINSFIKNKFSINATCKNVDHINKIAADELPVESLLHELTIKNTDFITDYIDEIEAHKVHDEIVKNYGLELTPLTFLMSIELQELYEELIPLNDEGIRDDSLATPASLNLLFIANYAKYLHSNYGTTLKEKIDFFKLCDLPPDVYLEIQRFQKATYHNIKEQVVSTCKECGGEVTTNIAIKPRNFFP